MCPLLDKVALFHKIPWRREDLTQRLHVFRVCMQSSAVFDSPSRAKGGGGETEEKLHAGMTQTEPSPMI